MRLGIRSLGIEASPLFGNVLALLRTARSWYSSKSGGDQLLTAEYAPPGGIATIGSSSSTTTNDPTFLDHIGEDYVWLPSTVGNNLLLPSSTGIYPTSGDLDIQVELHPDGDTWASAGNGIVVSKFSGGGTAREWNVQLLATGILRLNVGNGTDAVFYDSSSVISLSGRGAVRVTFEADNGSSQSEVTFYEKSTWEGSWTQLGASQTKAVRTVLEGAQPIYINTAFGGASVGVAGKWYNVRVLDGVDGSELVSFDGTDTGWTVNRSSTGLKTAVVTRPVYLFDGTDDYIQLPASDTPTFTATTGKHTVVVAFRTFDTGTNYLVDWHSADTNGFGIYLVGTTSFVMTQQGGSNVSSTQTGVAYGDLAVVAAVVDDGGHKCYVNGSGLGASSDFSGIGALVHATGMIGRKVINPNFQTEATVFDVLSFPDVALTEEELDDISAKLIAGTYSPKDLPSRIVSSATSWYSSKDGGGQEIDNRNDAGADPAVTGSSNVDTTNDPTFLDHTGDDYVWTSGNTSNNVSATVSTSTATEYEVRLDLAIPDWTPTGTARVYSSQANEVDFTPTGVRFTHTTGSVTKPSTNTAVTTWGLTDGERAQFRFHVDTTTGTLTTYTKLTGDLDSDTGWTERDSQTPTDFNTTRDSYTTAMLGRHILGGVWAVGSFYRVIGTSSGVVEFDCFPSADNTAQDQSSWTSSEGETWTVARSASGLMTAVVTRPVYLFDGVDDRIGLPSTDIPTITATTGTITLVALARRHAGGANDQLIHFSSASVNDIVALAINGSNQAKAEFRANGGSYFLATQGTVPTDGSLFVVAAVFDAGTSYAYANGDGLGSGTDYTSAGTINPMTFARVGERPGPADQYTGELFDVLSFPDVALTETELDDIAAKLIAGTYNAD